jgi:tagatose-6-phosphate ketose/aldose isomerase
LQNPLRALLELAEEEKDARGLRYTPQEISQQPSSWESTYQRCLQRRAELGSFLKKSGIGGQDASAPVVFLVGAGTSDYVGRAVADVLRQRWSSLVWAVPSTDLLTNMESLIVPGRRYLWISFSRSGDSSEGVAVLQKALTACPQIRHLVVTCNEDGRMAQLCSEKPERALALVLDKKVNDQGLAMTSSFSNMVVAGQCLAHLEEMDRYGEILGCMVEMGSRFLRNAADVAAAIAAMNYTKACFVGSGPLAAVATESALKLLELTAGKIHTMSESALGFRHGPMSALNESTLYTQFVSNDPRRQAYDVDLLKEIRNKQLAGVTVVVAPQRTLALSPWADHLIPLDAPPTFKDEYRPPLDVMFAQLLGLFSSLHAGLQPDRPSPNGAINRVVSHLQVYP